MFSQDPISVPFRVEVFPCNSEPLTVSTPPLLSLEKTLTSGNFVQNLIKPQWYDLFVSGNPTRCPVAHFELLDTSGNANTNPSIVLQNSQDPITARIDVRNDATFTTSVRLKGSTNSKSVYTTL